MIGPIVLAILTIVGSVWVFVQMGQFVKERISWKPEKLFWAFWTCLVSLVLLSAHVLDLYYQKMP